MPCTQYTFSIDAIVAQSGHRAIVFSDTRAPRIVTLPLPPPLPPLFFIDIPLFFFSLFPPRSLMHVRERGETRSNEPDIDRAHPSRTSHDNVKMTLKWIGNDWKMTFNDHSEVTLTSFWHYNDLLFCLVARGLILVYIISSLFSVARTNVYFWNLKWDRYMFNTYLKREREF